MSNPFPGKPAKSPKTPLNSVPQNPRITVFKNQSRDEARNTHGGVQKSEEHYRKIVDRAVNAVSSSNK